MKDNKKSIWKPTCDRFIAFFDIMGFQDYVYRNHHDKVFERMMVLSSLVEEIENKYKLTSETNELDGSFSVSFDYSVVDIHPVMFSDSIILITNNDSFDAALNILDTSSKFIGKSLMKGIPIKGAIAHGTFSANKSKSIFFGQPLIDAYNLEEELELYGTILHHTIEKKLFDLKILLPFKEDQLLVSFKTPLKSGKINHYNLNWMNFIENKSKIEIIESIESFNFETSGRPRRYIDNTIDFINFL